MASRKQKSQNNKKVIAKNRKPDSDSESTSSSSEEESIKKKPQIKKNKKSIEEKKRNNKKIIDSSDSSDEEENNKKKLPTKKKSEKKEVKKSPRKKPIPKALRTRVWKKYIGDSLKGTCYVCDREVQFDNFDCAHIIAEANGGELNVDNLRVTCKPCNTSCHTKNLDDFKKTLMSKNNLKLDNKESPKSDNNLITPIFQNDIKGRVIYNVTVFFDLIKTFSDRLLINRLLEAKTQSIKNNVEKFKKEHPDIPISYELANIENLIPNSQPSNMTNMIGNPAMKKYFDDWFFDIKQKFMTFINNSPHVVEILNASF